MPPPSFQSLLGMLGKAGLQILRRVPRPWFSFGFPTLAAQSGGLQQLEYSVGQYFCHHLHLWPASLIRMVCVSGEFQNKNWLWVFCHSLILLRSRKDYQWLPVTAGTRNSSKDAEAWHIRICCSRSLADAALYRWWSTLCCHCSAGSYW